MITYTLLAILVVFSLYAFSDQRILHKYLFHPWSIYHNGEHYRFLTHAFIHGDYIHLAFNCLALYSFGLSLEEGYFGNPEVFDPRIGKVLYLILFTGGIYAASFTEYFRNRHTKSYTSLGASGAISSLIFCYIVISPLSKIQFFYFPVQGWIMGLLLLGVSYYLIRRKRNGTYNDNISHESHYWGALFGILFIVVVKPSVVRHFFLSIAGSF